MKQKKMQGPAILVCIALMLGGLDYYLATRVEDAVVAFEKRASAGQCTPQSPCRLTRIEADVCNTFVGQRLFPAFYSFHIADSLEGEVRAPRGCPRSRRAELIYVAPGE